MTKYCVVRRCRLNRTQSKSRRYFGFPSTSADLHTDRLNAERRKRWILALCLDPNFRWSSQYVCGDHFVSGKPAKNTDVNNIDWVPSLQLPVTESEPVSSEPRDDGPRECCSGSTNAFSGNGTSSMDQPSDLEDTSPEEEEQLVGEEVDLGEVLLTELEIKEEEVELDGLEEAPDDVEDPIGECVRNGSDTGVSTASADDAVRRDALNFRKRKIKKSGSSTESANESLKKEKIKAPVKPKRGVKRKRKNVRKVTSNGLIVPRFVPGMMVQRKKQFLCLECGQQFDSIFLFATHTTRFHLAKMNHYPHSCFYCPRKFRRKLALQRHLLHHIRLEAIRCPICRETFHSACDLANHMVNHQVVPKKPEVVPISKNPIYSKTVTPLDNVCFACGVTEPTEDDLINHVNLHQGHLQCKPCYEMLASPSEFLDHVQTVHNNQVELTYYSCPHQYCPKSFLSASDMQKHSQACTPPKLAPEKQPFSGSPQTCDICNLTYYEVDHFVTHLRLHSVLGRETQSQKACPFCAFVANDSGKYGSHMVKAHGYRDRMASLVETYGKLNIVAPEVVAKQDLGGSESSDEG